MIDLPDPIEFPDPPVREAATTELRSLRQSYFSDILWRWQDVFVGLAPLLLPRAMVTLARPEWLYPIARVAWVPLFLLFEAWMFAYPLAIARRRQGFLPRLPRVRGVVTEALIALLLVVPAFIAMYVSASLVAYLFGASALVGETLDPSSRGFSRMEFLTLVFLAVVVAPIAEEVFNRGLLYSALRQRFHPSVAVTASACVFGFLHPYGLANSIGVAVVGAVFALVYEWRKTLVTPILLHSAVNVVVMSIATWTAAADAAAPRLGVYVEGGGDGARVTQVSPGSTADTAGLRVGDVVTAVDGFSITDRLSLTEAVRRKRLGETVVVDFIRDGKALRVEAVLTKLRE